MSANYPRLFAVALHTADYSEEGAALWITVKYRNSQEEYDEWSPVRLDTV